MTTKRRKNEANAKAKKANSEKQIFVRQLIKNLNVQGADVRQGEATEYHCVCLYVCDCDHVRQKTAPKPKANQIASRRAAIIETSVSWHTNWNEPNKTPSKYIVQRNAH